MGDEPGEMGMFPKCLFNWLFFLNIWIGNKNIVLIVSKLN